jgi:hypothetical protein
VVDDKQEGDATLWRKDSSIKIHKGVDNDEKPDKVTE